MVNPYHHVRWRWWSRVDLKKLVVLFEESFKVDQINFPTGRSDASLYTDDRMEIIVSADTLTAYLSLFRAVLNQKESASFTEKDLELRKKVREIYTHDRPTPFPWSFLPEPKFGKIS